MSLIEVWVYDVWGNDEDGYDVNDRSKVASYETDKKELSDKDIKEIIEEYFLNPDKITLDNNVMSDNCFYLLFNDKDHSDYPLGEIDIFEES